MSEFHTFEYFPCFELIRWTSFRGGVATSRENAIIQWLLWGPSKLQRINILLKIKSCSNCSTKIEAFTTIFKNVTEVLNFYYKQRKQTEAMTPSRLSTKINIHVDNMLQDLSWMSHKNYFTITSVSATNNENMGYSWKSHMTYII